MVNRQGLTQNLKPCRSKEEARERGSLGGKASVRARRRKKEFRKVLEELLLLDSSQVEGMSNLEGICVSLVNKAQDGDVSAATWIRDTVGQKPTEKVDQLITGGGLTQISFQWKTADEQDAGKGLLPGAQEEHNLAWERNRNDGDRIGRAPGGAEQRAAVHWLGEETDHEEAQPSGADKAQAGTAAAQAEARTVKSALAIFDE